MIRAFRSRRLLAGLVIALVAALVVFFVIGKPKRETIRIVTPPTIIASLPHWVAENEKFYRDEGLKVQTITVTSSPLMVQAIISNDADVLPAVSLVDVINSQSQALNRPLVFSHSRMRATPPFEALVVLSGSSVASLRDLEGQKVAVYPGATATACMKLFLAVHQVDPEKVVFRPLPPPEHIPALQRGDVVASHLYEPHRTLALEGNLCREIARSIYPSLNEPSAIGVSAVSARFAQESHEAMDKYLKVWDRAITFIREHPTEARAILAAKLNLSPTVARNATWVDATLFSEMDPTAISQTIATIKRLGLVPNDFDSTAGAHLLHPR